MEATLVHRLGHESVSDPVLAVLELIKNSYDADATQVTARLSNLRTGKATVTITDDGSGMTAEQLAVGWMRVATSMKSEIRITPIYKRRMLGEKGIGRFAVENLSRVTTVRSYPRDESKGFVVRFDWSKFTSGADLQNIGNERGQFDKSKDVHGLEIVLEDIRQPWNEGDVQRLIRNIKSLTPPAVAAGKFVVNIESDEFKDATGTISSDFLDKAVFVFDAILQKNGDISYKITKHGKAVVKEKSGKITDFKCGPVSFRLHFYYREKNKLKQNGIEVDDIKSMKTLLDDYGGIKVYRDLVRLSGFGNSDDDWTGLDALSRNDPTVVPARNQIIAAVLITSKDNPEINDTTTRENLIKNQSFQDLLKFVNDSVGVFAQMRGEIEQKRRPAPAPTPKYIQSVRDQLQKSKEREALLDFANQYPLIFYQKLEEEVNKSYASGLPNATLMLSRKLVENLLYNILEDKFPDKINLRYDINQGRAKDFSVLIEALENSMSEFNREQRDLIAQLLVLVKPFRKEANSKSHKVIDYLENIDDLSELKIPSIVQDELYLLQKVRAESKK